MLGSSVIKRSPSDDDGDELFLKLHSKHPLDSVDRITPSSRSHSPQGMIEPRGSGPSQPLALRDWRGPSSISSSEPDSSPRTNDQPSRSSSASPRPGTGRKLQRSSSKLSQSSTPDSSQYGRRGSQETVRSSASVPTPMRRGPPPSSLRRSLVASRPISELFPASPGVLVRHATFATAVRTAYSDDKASLTNAISNIDVGLAIATHKRHQPLTQKSCWSSTASAPVLRRVGSAALLKQTLSRNGSVKSLLVKKPPASSQSKAASKRGSQFSGIDKTASRRSSVYTAKRSSRIESASMLSPTSPGPMSPKSPTSPMMVTRRHGPGVQMPWSKRKRGETMSMLIDAGFFPIQELIYTAPEVVGENAVHAKKELRIDVDRRPLSPESLPPSIDNTPIEMIAPRTPSPRTPLARRRVEGKKRSPLSRVAEDGDPPQSSTSDGITSTLAAIFEDGPSHVLDEPVATEIQLVTGTVLTVTPPEATAWQRSVYLQGPIRLQRPSVLPRDDSIATLAAFQDVVDEVYQESLAQSRWQNDDACFDEIGDWVRGFGFDEPAFKGIERFEIWEDKANAHSHDSAQVDKALAEEAAFQVMKQLPQPTSSSEGSTDTNSNRNSMGSSDGSRAPEPPSRSSFEWDEDVEETSEKPTWLLQKQPSKVAITNRVVPKKPQNPMMKMRRFVQTASAIL